MKVQELQNKKILILGLGREGVSSFTFLRETFPKKTLGLADQLSLEKLNPKIQKLIQKDKNVELHLGKNYLEAIKKYEIVFKTPGISPFLPQIRKAKIPILSETELFFDLCPGKIIGITGTKGKGTTSTLIYKILKKSGKKVFLVGNIGTTRLKLLPKLDKNSWLVYELSSHQLLGLKKSPHIAILLNIFPEHLDYYQSFDQYAKAKANITRYQTAQDFFIFNYFDKQVRKIAQKTKAQKIPFNLTKRLCPGCFVKNKGIIHCSDSKEEKIIDIGQIPLKGKFNLQNVMPAIIVGKLFNVPTQKITQAIQEFKPLEHRLEKVGMFKGITFYNDSLSTVPQAAVEAIEALEGKIQTIILGGFERHQNFQDLAQKIWMSNIEVVILFPTTGKRIWKNIVEIKPKKEFLLPKHFFVKNMKEAIKLAYQNTSRGKICLLSPASPSFNLFKDYKERGSLFKKYVKGFAAHLLKGTKS